MENLFGVVSYLSSSSNHNCGSGRRRRCLLYLIYLHHQTTTSLLNFGSLSCCILSIFIIKPQHHAKDMNTRRCCILSIFIIKPQPIRKIYLIYTCLSHVLVYRKWHNEYLIVCKYTKIIPIVLVSSELFALSLPKCLLFPNTAYLLS